LDAVPNKLPVIPFTAVILPENIEGPIFVKVFDPDTVTDPVTIRLPIILEEPVISNPPDIWKEVPTANTKLLLLESLFPFPIMNALCTEDD